MTPYPLGSRVVVDADTRVLADGSLFGGSPARVLRLSRGGRAAWAELVAGEVRSSAGARLARRLTDAGVLHPDCTTAGIRDVTVVIPVRDRAGELDRCLAALGTEHPVMVVDDASHDPKRIAAVCARHGVRLIARPRNGGPAAARGTALAELDSAFVLFLDSDTVPPAGLVSRLAGHLADPLVAAVAPRIVALPGSSLASRYGMAAGSLDLGPRPARVAPGTRHSYVPTAALLVRRAALDGVAGFDPALRYGEDVDLVWRLDAAGWRVRYEPAVQIRHLEPEAWRPLLQRRFRYGTSAGDLALRHPDALAPLVLHSWSGVAVLGALARRPSLALAGLAGSAVTLRRTLAAADVDTSGAALEAVRAAGQTWRQCGRVAAQFGAPLLLAGAVAGGRGARGRRLALAALAGTPPLLDWRAGPRTLGPAQFVLARLADDVAYGSGVIAGSLRARTAAPLTPRLTHRLLRIAPRALHAVPSAPGPTAAPVERSAHA